MDGGNPAPSSPKDTPAIAAVLEASASEGAILEADRLGAIGIGASGSNSALPAPASFA